MATEKDYVELVCDIIESPQHKVHCTPSCWCAHAVKLPRVAEELDRRLREREKC